MDRENMNKHLKLLQDMDMKDKVILVRVDHNVVKNGIIKDPYRIDATIGTLYSIAEKGGRPILMTHVGRPRDKDGQITCHEGESVKTIVRYLEEKLCIKIHAPEFPIDPDKGIVHLNQSIQPALEDLRQGKIGMIYLPNSRWFCGEQAKGLIKESFAKELADIADIYINDAFGSYRAHASTYDISNYLPSAAGYLLQKEIINLDKVINPQRPFVAVIAGSKYDTKIGPLKALYEKVDHLILGGLMYNIFLSAKYGCTFKGVSDEDRKLAMELVKLDNKGHKILEMPYIVESDTMECKISGRYRTLKVKDLKSGKEFMHGLDIDPGSFKEPMVQSVIDSAKTIFVNAVMGFMPHFYEGSQALYKLINSNNTAMRLFGGGDTLQELKNLCPGDYMTGIDHPNTYYFTGGGSVLAAIEQGGPYQLKPVKALMEEH